MNVNEIMCTKVSTCGREDDLRHVARLMWEQDCGAVPVVNEQGEPVGMVTDRDIAMSAMLNDQTLAALSVSQVIQGQRLCSCEQEDSVENCLTKMEQNGIRRLPIVDAQGRLAGIVSMGDALAFAAKMRKSRARKANNAVPVPELISMLQHVSGHHQERRHEIARAS